MTIPPFPSQDLAKLVLGYLAEEQLMTAYDEFLQASPYLDALRNEYDRIFMTSLKNILAEYRAVKIYVETCKPFILRKKLVQCTNLLEVVKLLVSFADVNKLQSQDVSSDKAGALKQNVLVSSRQNVCEVCDSLNLASCVCKSKQSRLSVYSASYVETSSLENSVETTALEDLPGNHVTTRKKHTRLLEKDSISESALNSSDNVRQPSIPMNISNNGINCNNQSIHMKTNETSSLNVLSGIVKPTDTPECREKIEEFNNILNKVCNKSNSESRLCNISEPEALGCGRVSNTSFQEFALGVTGQDNKNVPVPDSSTSENLLAQTFVKDNTRDINNITSKATSDVNEHSGIQLSNPYPYPRIKPKPNDQKIKIISDIKVDSQFATKSNATSTPLMQTIVINGTPAYKQKLPVANNNYTKDEIMAMPTIIVVPTSGPPQKLTQTQPVLSQKLKKVKTKSVSSTRLLGPLVIDVSSSPAAIAQDNDPAKSNQPLLHLQSSGKETGLVKTVDVTKNASVPKDNTISGATHTNTPQVLPPLRKSSSTPRRNSHIRVLDFTTPRRILHETINEKVPEEANSKAVEIVVTGSPNVIFSETNDGNNIVDMSTIKVHKIDTCQITNLQKDGNDVKPVSIKKTNWDADLRALAIANEKATQVTKRKPRVRSSKKKAENSDKPPETNKEMTETTETKKSRGKRKSSPKVKKTKRRKLEEEEEQYNDTLKISETKVAVKPTFNIVAADLRNTQQENIKVTESQNKLNNEEINETPEAERISLQNEIGAKLNISDLLETPYKQALYDIQMETPKFLGSVLPDEPISDIKIMNIPTPRFFDTPKPAIATPYSSRATDYSSGGSYYKPDEQDYLRIPDLECPVTSSKEEPNIEVSKENDKVKSSRPVRKCTKNVSYKSGTTKSKVIDDKLEVASTCSDSTSINSSFDNSHENTKLAKTSTTPKTPKTPKTPRSKLNLKSESKKKLEAKKKKSPMKKDKSNTFMKIKPRRPTPTKDSNKRSRRKTATLQTVSPKTQLKRRSGKEKNIPITPMVMSAPTKSRRKSSTPRKLHCTKQFNSESSADSPEMNVANVKVDITSEQSVGTLQDSDTEHLALRWSDDGSQEGKSRVSECEDISKIKEYIENTVLNKTEYSDPKGTLQVDLIKRGFDAETAKIIERDLLDTPPDMTPNPQAFINISVPEKDATIVDKSTEADTSVGNDLQIVQDDNDEDDLELSAYECNEESENYITYNSEAKDIFTGQPVTLKDAWNMEVCIDEGETIRLRATTFNMLFDVPENEETGYSFKETEVAVSSISNIDTLYTPLKDRRTQCYEIFDSTLTSLDTPLKLSSPKEKVLETTEIEIVVEEEIVDIRDKIDTKKRKRLQSGNSSDESLNESKKTKPEAQLLFNSTNIQNIDIESVLKKLHGP